MNDAATRRLGPLTREGAFWFFVALAMLVTGLVKGINLVTLLSCFIVVLVGWNWWTARRQLRCVTAKLLLLEAVHARSPWKIEVLARNDGSKTAQGIHVQLSLDRTHDWFLTELAPGATATLTQEVVFARRGRVLARPLLLESGFPLGLARAAAPSAEAIDLVIFPELGILQRNSLRALLKREMQSDASESRQTHHHANAQMMFHGLRNYRLGDSPRLVHWRTSARRGELMVREFEDWPNDPLILIVEAAQRDSEGDDPLLERTISFAATICTEWCRQTGEPFALVIAGQGCQLIQGTTGRDLLGRMLTALALEPGAPQPMIAPVAEFLTQPKIPAAPILLARNRPSPLEGLLRERLHRPILAWDIGSDKEGSLFQL
jgi:uncharacterized protein (DUF58 family)